MTSLNLTASKEAARQERLKELYRKNNERVAHLADRAQARIRATMNSPIFRQACELAQVPPTNRQAAKFCRHQGLAYRFVGQARKAVASQK